MTSAHTDEMLELASLCALDALDPAERSTVLAHIRECPVCADEYAAALAATGGLAAAAAEQPPAALRARVLGAAIARSRTSAPISIFRRKRFYAAIVAVAAAIAALIVFGTPSNREQSWAISCLPGATACRASGRVIAADGVLRLEATGLSALPPGKVYQAWIIQPGGKPVPEPTFEADARGHGAATVPGGQPKGTLLAVTVEPAGGSKAPTTKPFIAATLN